MNSVFEYSYNMYNIKYVCTWIICGVTWTYITCRQYTYTCTYNVYNDVIIERSQGIVAFTIWGGGVVNDIKIY